MRKNNISISDALGGRFDPRHLVLKKEFDSIKTLYSYIDLKDISICKPQYGAGESAINKVSEDDVRYIRITDIDENGLLKNNIFMTAENIEESYLLDDGDLLFARSGATAGKTLLYEKEMPKSIFAGYLIRFKLNKKLVIPKYVFYYTQLNHYKKWKDLIQRASAQPNINAEEYQSLPIVLPNLKVQQEIVELMDYAYKAKKEREEQVKKLLDSIDDYVLSELGVKKPLDRKDMVHISKISNMLGDRFDFKENRPYKRDYNSKIESQLLDGYSMVYIKDICESGRGRVVDKIYISENVGDFPIYSSQTENNGVLGNINTYDFDGEYLTWTTDGAKAGKVFYRNGKFSCTNVCGTLKSKIQGLDMYYLGCYLNTVTRLHVKQQGNPKLMNNDMDKIKVVIPPLEIQNKVSSHVRELIEKSNKLKQESVTILEESKAIVEKMIIEV